MENLTIDVELFINAVQKRRPIWDPTCEHYRDKLARRNAWTDISKIVCKNYNEKTEDEKAQIEATLISRWRNLRDAFARHLRLTATRQSENKSKLIKPYIYEKQLQFIKSVIAPRRKKDILVFNDFNDNEEVENKKVKVLLKKIHSVNSHNSNSSGSSLRKIRKVSNDQRITKSSTSRSEAINTSTTFQKSIDRDYDLIENDDMSFFKSLLPIVRTLDSDKKLTFRIQVMKLLTNYTRNSTVNIIDSDDDNLYK